MSMTVQIRQRGALTLPSKLRDKYHITEGDTFTLIDIDGAFVLLPRVSIVPKLAAEIEQAREKAGLSVDDLLNDLEAERQRYHREKYGRR